MKILLIKPSIEKVETYLTRTYFGLGDLSPKSNVRIQLNNDLVELIWVEKQGNNDLFLAGDFILIFPPNSFTVIWERAILLQHFTDNIPQTLKNDYSHIIRDQRPTYRSSRITGKIKV